MNLILIALAWIALALVTCWCIRRHSTRRRPEFPPMPHAERLHHSTKRAGPEDQRAIDWQAMRERRV